MPTVSLLVALPTSEIPVMMPAAIVKKGSRPRLSSPAAGETPVVVDDEERCWRCEGVDQQSWAAEGESEAVPPAMNMIVRTSMVMPRPGCRHDRGAGRARPLDKRRS